MALCEGMDKDSVPTTDDLNELRDYLDVEAEAWLLDIEGRKDGVISKYCAEESTGDCSASVTVILDQDLRVQYLGATHDKDGVNALDVMLGLFPE